MYEYFSVYYTMVIMQPILFFSCHCRVQGLPLFLVVMVVVKIMLMCAHRFPTATPYLSWKMNWKPQITLLFENVPVLVWDFE